MTVKVESSGTGTVTTDSPILDNGTSKIDKVPSKLDKARQKVKNFVSKVLGKDDTSKQQTLDPSIYNSTESNNRQKDSTESFASHNELGESYASPKELGDSYDSQNVLAKSFESTDRYVRHQPPFKKHSESSGLDDAFLFRRGGVRDYNSLLEDRQRKDAFYKEIDRDNLFAPWYLDQFFR